MSDRQSSSNDTGQAQDDTDGGEDRYVNLFQASTAVATSPTRPAVEQYPRLSPEQFYYHCLEMKLRALVEMEMKLRLQKRRFEKRTRRNIRARRQGQDTSNWVQYVRAEPDSEAEADLREQDYIGMLHEIVKFMLREHRYVIPSRFAFNIRAVRNFESYDAPNWLKNTISRMAF